MERSNEVRGKTEQPSSSESASQQQLSPVPSPDQIRNLLMVMSDREQKLSELATQQQKFILWRVQFLRLEREWADVSARDASKARSITRIALDQKHDQ